jgi:acetyl-CoA carboxylase carboxyl transferase subunit alpha
MAQLPSFALEFERPLLDLERKIEELKTLSGSGATDFGLEISRLEKKARRLQSEIFSDLSRWQVTQLSRHPARPYFLDYIELVFTDFFELAGDRHYGEDPSIVGGWARLDNETVLVLGHQKGRNTKENMLRNFGMPRPEGYRKAILTFVDTPGAYPGIGAEERGQAEAIAANLEAMAGFSVPIVSTVIGEGGSGGALAIAVANRVLMLENSIYSVISPESCSTILYRDTSKAEKAADSLRLTARDLLEMKVVDELVPEPPGGAHRDPAETAEALGRVLRKHLQALRALSPEALVEDRYAKFRALGVFAGR